MNNWTRANWYKVDTFSQAGKLLREDRNYIPFPGDEIYQTLQNDVYDHYKYSWIIQYY